MRAPSAGEAPDMITAHAPSTRWEKSLVSPTDTATDRPATSFGRRHAWIAVLVVGAALFLIEERTLSPPRTRTWCRRRSCSARASSRWRSSPPDRRRLRRRVRRAGDDGLAFTTLIKSGGGHHRRRRHPAAARVPQPRRAHGLDQHRGRCALRPRPPPVAVARSCSSPARSSSPWSCTPSGTAWTRRSAPRSSPSRASGSSPSPRTAPPAPQIGPARRGPRAPPPERIGALRVVQTEAPPG